MTTPTRHRGAELAPVGRARRFAVDGGGELWNFDRDAEPIVRRLAALGATGIGGFVEAAVDADGSWLYRVDRSPSLLEWIRAVDRHPWADVVGRLVEYADRLASCEARSLSPGRILPTDISLAQEAGVGLHLMAPQLVADLVGALSKQAQSTPGASRWMPPRVEAGGRWDGEANRYVLGLVAYRALSGQHAFGGAGLRRAMDEQAERGAPPMPEQVARELPPGLQSLCLRLLAPQASQRPTSAAEARDRLAAFTRSYAGAPIRPVAARPGGDTASGAESVSDRVSDGAAVRSGGAADGSDGAAAGSDRAAVGSDRAAVRSRGRVWGRRLAVAVPWIAGVGAAAAISFEPPAAPAADPSVRPYPPLTELSTTADDCAGCHPRQAGQWHGSVMAHSATSPLFQGLEMLIEEQVGRAFDCPEGAGILRRVDGRTACRDRDTGFAITGSGGEHWCVNCHAAADNLDPQVPAWDGVAGSSRTRRPLRDLLPATAMEGISCAFCHQVHGPTQPGHQARGLYEGNPDWRSFLTGQRFSSRPEDRRGQPGIANSGYLLDPGELLADRAPVEATTVPTGAHVRPSGPARDYLRSSEFCGACHDVRLFGTDAVGIERGEHFKRLRNAYSEWVDWSRDERAAGRTPASCQDCHMSTFPGVCVSSSDGGNLQQTFPRGDTALQRACPPGTVFAPRAPGARPDGAISSGSATTAVSTHYFTGVDVPLSDEFPVSLVDDSALDVHGLPRGARQRRDLLLGSTFRFELGEARRTVGRIEIPIELENIGAGHKVPAGFSQEREFWVHLRVIDARGRVVYEVGRVERGDEDLRDKLFARVNVDDGLVDGNGAPQGVFGADVVDGPDVPQWTPDPRAGGREFRGRGLVNLQNGFLRCVTCIGRIDDAGRCQPGPGQGRHRADRFADGQYDLDTGECFSNLGGDERFFEVYFPVGALDASRGGTKGPDAIIDTRSAPPGVPLRYVYDLDAGRAEGSLRVEARLLFRAFPPFLVKAFAAYEAQQAARGRRPSGALVTRDMLGRLEVVELHRLEVQIP